MDLSSDALNESPVLNDMLIINVIKLIADVPDVLPCRRMLMENDLSRVEVLFNFKRPIVNAILVSSVKSGNVEISLQCKKGDSPSVVASY